MSTFEGRKFYEGQTSEIYHYLIRDDMIGTVNAENYV